MSKDGQEFTGPGFDQLRGFLEATEGDSSQALATLDIADKFAIGAVIMAGGGLGSRLAADRHSLPGGNFRHRTDSMFGDENRNRAEANEVTKRMMLRQAEDPAYAEAIEFLTTGVIRSIDRSSRETASVKMGKIARGFKAIVAEVCTKPYEGKHFLDSSKAVE
jgi:hypothetical protein